MGNSTHRKQQSSYQRRRNLHPFHFHKYRLKLFGYRNQCYRHLHRISSHRFRTGRSRIGVGYLNLVIFGLLPVKIANFGHFWLFQGFAPLRLDFGRLQRKSTFSI